MGNPILDHESGLGIIRVFSKEDIDFIRLTVREDITIDDATPGIIIYVSEDETIRKKCNEVLEEYKDEISDNNITVYSITTKKLRKVEKVLKFMTNDK